MFKRNADMLKPTMLVFSIASLIGCGGSGNSEPLISERIDTVIISGSGGSSTINSSNRTDLTISGLNNTIEIETDLRNLVISGSNNLLNFEDGVAIQACTLSGSDNTATISGNASINCNDTGSANMGF